MKKLLKDQVKEKILKYIVEKNLHPGDRLLSEKQFAQNFTVNHLTVRTALASLVDDGILEKRPRSGAYLKKTPAPSTKPIPNNFVAVLLETKGHFFSQLYTELCKELEENNLTPVSFSHENFIESEDPTYLMERVKAMNIRKLILVQEERTLIPEAASKMHLTKETDNYWEKVIWLHGDALPEHDYCGDFVLVASDDILNLSMNHLHSLGHKKIALVTNNWDTASPMYNYNTSHLRDYCDIMTKLGIPEHIQIIKQSISSNQIISELEQLFRSPNRPTAIIGSIDYRSVCAIKAANNIGLKIPQDIAIVGNINTPWAYEYDLTSVDHDAGAIVSNTLRLLKKSGSARGSGSIIYVSPHLVVRGSSKQAKSVISEDEINKNLEKIYL